MYLVGELIDDVHDTGSLSPEITKKRRAISCTLSAINDFSPPDAQTLDDTCGQGETDGYALPQTKKHHSDESDWVSALVVSSDQLVASPPLVEAEEPVTDNAFVVVPSDQQAGSPPLVEAEQSVAENPTVLPSDPPEAPPPLV